MLNKGTRKRFGCLAMQMGFITKEQLIQAMKIQIDREGEGIDTMPIGLTLKKLGFINDKQIDEVVADIMAFERYKCPNCGMLLHECPNCGADLLQDC